MRGVLFIPFILILSLVCALVIHIAKPLKPQFTSNQYLECNSSSSAGESHQVARGNSCIQTPIFNSTLIPQPKFLLAAHAATLEVLPNGHLIALWFAGSHEGKPDVKIWQSVFDGNNWRLARPVITPAIVADATNRYVKKVGNPIVYQASNGKLHLFVVSVAIGGWSGSSLNHFVSDNGGDTWQDGQKLLLTPFINISTLGRTRAISLNDGGFDLPVYHEFMRTYPELLRFDKNGNFIQQTRLNSHNNLLQPALLPITANDAYVYMRNNGRNDKILYYQETHDGGINWSIPKPTNLTNQDSSLVVAAIGPSEFLMLHNIGNRNKLALAKSVDGKNWQDIYLLENGPSQSEFSYPAIQVHDGIVDILYTWERKDIKHVRFNLAWLEESSTNVKP